MSQLFEINTQDSDIFIDQMLLEYDKTLMPIPEIGLEPHLLISKVRKHYMEYIIKLLSINYENSQRLKDKNLRLPSAIWRCAKSIELSAAQTCMVVQIYRRNIITVIKELKRDTEAGKLHKTLYDHVRKPPENEKNVQTLFNKLDDCTCQCTCNQKRKRRRESKSPSQCSTDYITYKSKNNIKTKQLDQLTQPAEPLLQSDIMMKNVQSEAHESVVQSQDSDELLRQLEILFKDDNNDDDLFEYSLCSLPNSSVEEIKNKTICRKDTALQNENSVIKNQETSYEMSVPLMKKNEITKPIVRKSRQLSNKWLCEEYFLKSRLFQILDQLRDCNRAKLKRVKEMLSDLFGEDSDDEGVMSPLEETQEFVTSCKERIAPWVVKVMSPFYIKGRIKGKALFKSVAKHLIRLIYQCSKYPSEHEVKTFVSDFLESHKKIRCEADYKQFYLTNI